MQFTTDLAEDLVTANAHSNEHSTQLQTIFIIQTPTTTTHTHTMIATFKLCHTVERVLVCCFGAPRNKKWHLVAKWVAIAFSHSHWLTHRLKLSYNNVSKKKSAVACAHCMCMSYMRIHSNNNNNEKKNTHQKLYM